MNVPNRFDRLVNNMRALISSEITCKDFSVFESRPCLILLFSVPPYWTPRGDREYKISKGCDTRQGCNRRQSAVQSHCKCAFN